MKNRSPRWLKASAALCAMALLTVSSCLLLRRITPAEEAVSVFSEKSAASYGAFSPKVIDGQTGLPIEGAVVIVPEASLRQTTDLHGTTPEPIRIPYNRTPSVLSEKDWCEVTLLVYAEGYAPYALFYLQLRENTLRSGPTVMLFPHEGAAFSIIEGPPQEWVEGLVEKYRP